MNDIRNRITWLEFQLGYELEPAATVPEEWLAIDPATGDFVGPPPDASPAERQGFEELAAMDRSVIGWPGDCPGD